MCPAHFLGHLDGGGGAGWHTVAQKTAPMFTYFLMIVLVWDADIIQGPGTFSKELYHSSSLKYFRSCDLDQNQ